MVEEQTKKICLYCGKVFISQSKKQKFCNGICYTEWVNHRQPSTPYNYNGKLIFSISDKNTMLDVNPKNAIIPKKERICPTCGKTFIPYYKQMIYCSGICKNKKEVIIDSWKSEDEMNKSLQNLIRNEMSDFTIIKHIDSKHTNGVDIIMRDNTDATIIIKELKNTTYMNVGESYRGIGQLLYYKFTHEKHITEKLKAYLILTPYGYNRTYITEIIKKYKIPIKVLSYEKNKDKEYIKSFKESL